MLPDKAAVCLDSFTIYYEPKKGVNVDNIDAYPGFVNETFTKSKLIEINTNNDLKPVPLDLCANESSKVIVLEPRIEDKFKQLRVELEELPDCSSGWKCKPFDFLILCSLVFIFNK